MAEIVGQLEGAVTFAPSEIAFVSLLAGNLSLSDPPTGEPHVAGKVWSNNGVLTVSAG